MTAAPSPEAPRSEAPQPAGGACDCHIHIYDNRFPTRPGALLPGIAAGVDDYLRIRRRLGLARAVVVTPSAYGTDNRATLAALEHLGATARAVVVVDESITPAQLRALHRRGVRGVRFNLVQSGATTPAMIEPVARRIADLGWHVQIHALPARLIELEPLLSRLPTPLVIDHLGRVPLQGRQRQEATDFLLRRLAAADTWVKLSACYLESRSGPPTWADQAGLVRQLLQAAPERLVWGSDWPHPSEGADPPDDRALYDALSNWVPQALPRRRILVDNPQRLYDF